MITDIKTNFSGIRRILSIVVVVFLVFLISSCVTTRIDAGYEGIKIKQYGTEKGVQDVVLVTGRVWYNPMTEDVVQYPIFVQTVDYDAFNVNAKDGSLFTVDPTLSVRVTPSRSPEIFVKYRKDLKTVLTTAVANYVRDAYRLQMNKYTTEELVSNREQFETDVQNSLNEVLKREGFSLEQLTSGLKYPESIVNAVNAKNEAVQRAMQVENEIKVSEANARKLIIEAEAEKKANELRQQSLTPLLIQKQFIDKWDGQTPLYGNSPMMFKNVN